MITSPTTHVSHLAEHRLWSAGFRGCAPARLGRPAAYVAMVVAEGELRRIQAQRAEEEAYYRSLHTNKELVLQSKARAVARRYRRWGKSAGLGGVRMESQEESLKRSIDLAAKALNVSRRVEAMMERELVAKAGNWQRAVRAATRVAVHRLDRRCGQRQRGSRRSRVVARVGAKVSTAGGDSGDPEPEPPGDPRRRDSEVTP